MTTFFSASDARDPAYQILMTEGGGRIPEARAFVEDLWGQCQLYVDEDLPRKATAAYADAVWELYLAHALVSSGINLVPRSRRKPARQGPDLLAEDPPVWVEATAPGRGEGPDAVPESTFRGVRSVPDDQIILRYRTAIASKVSQLEGHRERGWVAENDIAIVAVNGSQIPSARAELTIPRIVRAVLPFGHETFAMDVQAFEVVERSFQYRQYVEKRNGARVAVDLFLDPSSRAISAVIGSCADDLNRPEVPGADFVLIHNPMAAVPLPRGWLPVGREFWVEDGTLRHHSHQ